MQNHKDSVQPHLEYPACKGGGRGKPEELGMIEATGWFWAIYLGMLAFLVGMAIRIELGSKKLEESRARFDAELAKFLRGDNQP